MKISKKAKRRVRKATYTPVEYEGQDKQNALNRFRKGKGDPKIYLADFMKGA